MTATSNCEGCGWEMKDPLLQTYHDREWGVPLHDDQKLFEFLVLESAQAGLSWLTILRRREGYRRAFAGFSPEKIARYSSSKVERLLKDASIIRNRAKIEATVNNAKMFLKIQEEFGSFDAYSWRFVQGRSILNRWKTLKQLPVTTKISDQLSKDMKARGFKFLGSTVIYAHMQAVGMVNDHLIRCFRHTQILA
jgi:DNA-3-methyladenine glycosylase I